MERAVYVLREAFSYSHALIAELLGISESANQRHRCGMTPRSGSPPSHGRASSPRPPNDGSPALHRTLVNGAPALHARVGDQVAGTVTFDITGDRSAATGSPRPPA